MDWVPGTRLVTSIGTIAPFSAISGAFNSTKPDSVCAAAPMAFNPSLTDLAAKAAVFHAAASARNGANAFAASRSNAPSARLRPALVDNRSLD